MSVNVVCHRLAQPPHEKVDIYYDPMPPRHSLEWEHQGRQEHAAVAYQFAGEWNLRLGVTRYGHLVFQPIGFNNGLELEGIRVTIEHMPTQGAVLVAGAVEIGIYRRRGLGMWQQTAVVGDCPELITLTTEPAMTSMNAAMGSRTIEHRAPYPTRTP